MDRPSLIHHQRGAGLLDVLVAMGVLSGAVASLAQLQAFAFRECAEARLRSVATLLARAKLDDLRAYSQRAAGAPGIFGFEEISSDGGGTEDGEGRLHFPAGAVLVDGVRFERRWIASPRFFCAADSAPADTPCASRPDLLSLTVVVSWADREGRTQRVALEGSAIATDVLPGAAPIAADAPI